MTDRTSEEIAQAQIAETVRQEMEQVTVRLATITCPCGRERGITLMYRCLYCGVWYCYSCAEDHFGKTVSEYKLEKVNGKN